MTESRDEKPILERVAGAVGLAITLAILAFIGWQALTSEENTAPYITVEAGAVKATDGGYLVNITVHNRAPATAAAVQIKGDLLRGGRTVESSQVSFDYIPGRSVKKGGLMFRTNPATAELQFQAMGYTEP